MATTAARPVDPFAEHITIMKALYQEYQKRDDVNNILQTAAVVEETQQLCQAQQTAVKDAIKGLTLQVDSLEAASLYPHPQGSHERRVAALEADIRDITQAIQQLEGSSREVDAQRAALHERLTDLSVRMKELEETLAAEEPLVRHQLSLFAHISKISWRLDIEDRMVGTVSDPRKGELRTVDIDPSLTSHFDAVNTLWALL